MTLALRAADAKQQHDVETAAACENNDNSNARPHDHPCSSKEQLPPQKPSFRFSTTTLLGHLLCLALGAALMRLSNSTNDCNFPAVPVPLVDSSATWVHPTEETSSSVIQTPTTAPTAAVLPSTSARTTDQAPCTTQPAYVEPAMTPLDAVAQAVRIHKLRVYTYPLPTVFNTDNFLHKSQNSDRLLAVERRMHEIFQEKGIATKNPEAADFFYVPIYPNSACAHAKYNCTSWNERPDCHGCKQGYQLILKAIEHLQTNYPTYFERNKGRDHIFPFFNDHGVCMETFTQDALEVEIPPPIRESIFLSHLGDESTNCYRSGQDIVIPPFVDDASLAATSKSEPPQNDDDIFMYFRGNTRLHSSSPKTRRHLVDLFGKEPDCIVTDTKIPKENMHHELARATFCLLPAGFAPWTYRFVEVIQHECIPVFFDDSDLPFADIIDYDKLAIKQLGDDDDLPNLLHKLRQLTPQEIEAKKDYIRKVKPLFSHYSAEFKQALMHELSLRQVHSEFQYTWDNHTDSDGPILIDDTTMDKKKAMQPSFHFDVDFVYTWVDGSDPEWLASKHATQQKFMPKAKRKQVRQDSTSDMRFRDREEMRYSLRSLQENVPWVRKIHIVVAGNQKPAWANLSHPMLNIVRHEDIFPHPQKDSLPTFNSVAIESFVDQIPGLAEHFVMMNDDCFIGKPMPKSKFFTFEGYPKVAFQDDWFKNGRICRNDLAGASAKHSYLHQALNVYRLADDAFGHEERSLVLHQACPLTKTLYSKAKKLFPEAYQTTSQSRFRTTKDIIPHFAALFTGFHDGTAIKLGPSEYPTNSFVNLDDNIKKNKRMISKFNRESYELFYINDFMPDDVSPDVANQLTEDMQNWMASMFPKPSQFEKKELTAA